MIVNLNAFGLGAVGRTKIAFSRRRVGVWEIVMDIFHLIDQIINCLIKENNVSLTESEIIITMQQ